MSIRELETRRVEKAKKAHSGELLRVDQLSVSDLDGLICTFNNLPPERVGRTRLSPHVGVRGSPDQRSS